MKEPFAIIVATVAIIAPAQAQQQSQVKVDGKDYTVNEMFGLTLRMVQLSGPELSAMVQVNNQNQITMYANPPAGGTPSQKTLIDNVWKAYVAQKSGNAVANNNATSTS